MGIGRGFSTATKIALVPVAWARVRGARLMAGYRTPEVECRRRGVR